MAKLVWDQIGSREFETGIDRGVLYDQTSKGYAWNGLTGISEDFSDDGSDPRYQEGTKVFDLASIGEFQATLTAFTYPDKFLEFEGVYEDSADGLFLGEQAPKTFGLSYRTRVGDDIDGVDAGYKIHSLYNLIAVPSTKIYETHNNLVTPLEFEWAITSMPQNAPGYRPTAHVIFDSRYVDPWLLTILESTFYGNETSNARQMSVADIIQYTKENWS